MKLRAVFLGLVALCVAVYNAEAQSQRQRQQQTQYGGRRIDTIYRNAPAEKQVIRIVVVGRSGSGVTSTIRELIGSKTECSKPERNKSLQNIYEYTISNIPDTTSQIKLIQIPGFLDGRTLEDDGQILATLKSYVSKLDGNPPDFFLALSRFDDNRIDGVNSLFVQFLKRLELFKDEFLGKLSKKEMSIIFLLTNFMGETKTIQRRPADRINSFRRVIDDYSSFTSSPYHIVVGDNHAQSEHNAPVEDGYYRLPNKEHYPKNIWEAMITSMNSKADATPGNFIPVLTAIKENREVKMECEAQLISADWDEYKADSDAFLYFLQKNNNWAIEQNEINVKIQKVFDGYPLRSNKVEGVIQKTALQLYFQNENITDIPTTYADRAAFFQKSSLISSTFSALLLNDALGLVMPEYIQQLTVGYGYDVLDDELSLETPFKTVVSLPSPIGYQLPNFMKCKKFPIHDIQNFQSYSQNISNYFEKRLEHLKFSMQENINFEKFSGKAKEGYNIAPEEGVEIATLTAAKEVRVLKCVLGEKDYWGELSDEFAETINSLQPVDLYDKDSITEWEVFFGKYGSHIVVQGYGGGKLVGSIVGTNVRKVYESQSRIDDTLNSILKFTPFSVPGLEKPCYQLFGGHLEKTKTQINQIYDVPEAQRDQLLYEWNESLNSNFEMLKHEFALERISTVVKEKIGADKGEMVDRAIELLLKGELKRKRRTVGSTTRPQNGATRRPTQVNRNPGQPSESHSGNNSHQSTASHAGNIAHQSTASGLPPIVPTFPSSNPTLNLNLGGWKALKPNRAAEEHHKNTLSHIKLATERSGNDTQSLIDNINRMNEEQGKRHALLMAQLNSLNQNSRKGGKPSKRPQSTPAPVTADSGSGSNSYSNQGESFQTSDAFPQSRGQLPPEAPTRFQPDSGSGNTAHSSRNPEQGGAHTSSNAYPVIGSGFPPEAPSQTPYHSNNNLHPSPSNPTNNNQQRIPANIIQNPQSSFQWIERSLESKWREEAKWYQQELTTLQARLHAIESTQNATLSGLQERNEQLENDRIKTEAEINHIRGINEETEKRNKMLMENLEAQRSKKWRKSKVARALTDVCLDVGRFTGCGMVLFGLFTVICSKKSFKLDIIMWHAFGQQNKKWSIFSPNFLGIA